MGQVLPFLETPQGSSRRPPIPTPRRVLIVERDSGLQNCFKDWLRRGDYKVQVSATADEGLQMFRDSGPFNVVVIDYFIPGNEQDRIDPLAASQTHSVELALEILRERPAQEIVMMARDYSSAAEVPLPPAMKNVRVLAGNCQLHHLVEQIEVERAFEMLTDAERTRLKNFADYKIRGLGRLARDRDGQDLLNEAQLRTLCGTRHWKMNVDFVHHLRETMRSIADQWKRRLRACPFGGNTCTDSNGEEYSLIDDAASGQVSIESWLIMQSELTRILELFKHDQDAYCILRGAGEGLKKSEIMSRYGLDGTRYAAAMHRIRQMFRAHGKGVN